MDGSPGGVRYRAPYGAKKVYDMKNFLLLTNMSICKRSILCLSMYYACARILIIINHPDHSHGHRNKHFLPSYICHHQAG